jgi:hypothetical protein
MNQTFPFYKYKKMNRPFSSKVYWRFISIMLIIFALMSFLYNRRIIEGLDNQDPSGNPVTSAIVSTCSCPNYDASFNDMQSQISALQSKINDAISETQQNIQSVSDGISNLNGSGPTPSSTSGS